MAYWLVFVFCIDVYTGVVVHCSVLVVNGCWLFNRCSVLVVFMVVLSWLFNGCSVLVV